MSLFPKESAQTMAESLGLSISDTVAAHLVQDSEYRLREIIHEATKFMKASKRCKLLPSDINYALRVKNVEPLYGYDVAAPSEFRMTTSGSHVLYYVADKEYDLEELISAELPQIPLDVTMSAHWLAIEGVQPRIIQNPTPADLMDREKRLVQTNDKPALSSNGEKKDGGPLIKTVLTRELALYYSKIIESLLSSDENVRKSGIESVGQDPGIQGLLPYLVDFLSETISKNISNLRVMWTMMRLIRAILYNPDLFVEPYLHHLTPNILSCLLAKKLSETSLSSANDCRIFASQLLSHICLTYGDAYPTLVPRVTKTLLRAFLDSSKSLGYRHGAIVGLEGLGPTVLKSVVLPNVKSFAEEMQIAVTTPEFAAEGEACIQAMQRLLVTLAKSELKSRIEAGESSSQAQNYIHRTLGPQLGLYEKRVLSQVMDS